MNGTINNDITIENGIQIVETHGNSPGLHQISPSTNRSSFLNYNQPEYNMVNSELVPVSSHTNSLVSHGNWSSELIPQNNITNSIQGPPVQLRHCMLLILLLDDVVGTQ